MFPLVLLNVSSDMPRETSLENLSIASKTAASMQCCRKSSTDFFSKISSWILHKKTLLGLLQKFLCLFLRKIPRGSLLKFLQVFLHGLPKNLFFFQKCLKGLCSTDSVRNSSSASFRKSEFLHVVLQNFLHKFIQGLFQKIYMDYI